MTEYTLHYYDSRGLAEPIRYILAHAGVSWKDERIPVTDPTTPIPDSIKALTPFGQVPLLLENGKPLAQSMTIARYLARKYNLMGKDEWEAAKCDEIVDTVKDFISLWGPVYREKDEEKKATLKAEAIKTSKERYVTKFNKMLEQNGGKYLVGSGLTWADLVVAHYLENGGRIGNVQLVEDAPELQGLINTVNNTPGIQEWIAKRPETKF